MAVLQVEIIVRPVKVRRHNGHVICPVLQVKTLAHLQTGNFRHGVRLVRVFQRACQQAILPHRLGGLPGVDTGAAQEQQLLHPVPEALPDHVLLYL